MSLRSCPKCQVPVPTGAPDGLCPRCLIASQMPSGEVAPTQIVERAEQEEREADELRARLEAALPDLEIDGVLGRGGMGVVFRARQKKLDREVALKVMPPELGQDVAFRERFEREARTLARLSHPNIVQVHDFGQEGPLCYLVLEYVDGVNLRQLAEDRKLPAAEALAIVPQVCEALQYAHDQGVVHRDIKPENILLDHGGRVKIADFGLAKLTGVETPSLLTRSSQVMGTFDYMAPEQIERPLEVDHRADIFSLGVVFYELLTGELPRGLFDPPSRKSGVDARLDGVVLKSLEQQRERRYQKVSEVRTDLESIRTGAAPARPRPAGADRDAGTARAAFEAHPSNRPTSAIPRSQAAEAALDGGHWEKGGFRCPHCEHVAMPLTSNKLHAVGWIVFAGLILVFAPLCWLPFVIPSLKVKEHRCRRCRLFIKPENAPSAPPGFEARSQPDFRSVADGAKKAAEGAAVGAKKAAEGARVAAVRTGTFLMQVRNHIAVPSAVHRRMRIASFVLALLGLSTLTLPWGLTLSTGEGTPSELIPGYASSYGVAAGIAFALGLLVLAVTRGLGLRLVDAVITFALAIGVVFASVICLDEFDGRGTVLGPFAAIAVATCTAVCSLPLFLPRRREEEEGPSAPRFTFGVAPGLHARMLLAGALFGLVGVGTIVLPWERGTELDQLRVTVMGISGEPGFTTECGLVAGVSFIVGVLALLILRGIGTAFLGALIAGGSSIAGAVASIVALDGSRSVDEGPGPFAAMIAACAMFVCAVPLLIPARSDDVPVGSTLPFAVPRALHTRLQGLALLLIGIGACTALLPWQLRTRDADWNWTGAAESGLQNEFGLAALLVFFCGGLLLTLSLGLHQRLVNMFFMLATAFGAFACAMSVLTTYRVDPGAGAIGCLLTAIGLALTSLPMLLPTRREPEPVAAADVAE